MKQKLSINNKSCSNNHYYGNKIVIGFLLFLLCIDKSTIILCSGTDSSVELVVAEDTLPISNFVEKCEQRCYDQVGLYFVTHIILKIKKSQSRFYAIIQLLN